MSTARDVVERSTGSRIGGSQHVLHIAPGLAPWVGGPTESIPSDLRCTELAGFRPELLYIGDGSGQGLATLHGSGQRSRAGAMPRWARALPAGLRRSAFLAGLPSVEMLQAVRRAVPRAGLVHVHGVYTVIGAWAGHIAARRGTPVVVTAREQLTGFDIGTSSRPRRLAKRVIARFVLKRTSAVVFTSDLERTESGLLRGTNAFVVWHSVSSRPEARTQQVRARPTVGFIGRFHEKKNLAMLIEAVAALPANYRLLIAGGTAEALPRELRALLAQPVLRGRVELVGFVDGDSKEAFFSQLDILAMPSAFECFGMAAAEALVRGIPVIVSRRTGIAEVLEAAGGGGLVVDAAVSAVAAAISQLSDEPTHRFHAQIATERCARLLSDETKAQHLQGVYTTLLEGRRQPTPN